MFNGYITALVTPFKGGTIDEDAFIRLIDRQIDNGIHGVIVGGTTGEGLMITPAEHKRLLTLAVTQTAGRIPVIAGIFSITTECALTLARGAESANVSGLMITPPPYIKPNQNDMCHYVQKIHDNTNTPLILYSNPGRAVVSIHDNTLIKLAKLPRVVAFKDAGGDVTQILDRAPHLKSGFTQSWGDDALAPGALASGAGGVMSVTSNIAPGLCVDFYTAFQRGDFETFIRLRDRLHGLHRAIFSDTSPGTVKYALSRMGLCTPELREPLMGPGDTIKTIIDNALKTANLIQTTQGNPA